MNIDERFDFAQWRAAKEQEDERKREAFSRAVAESLRRKTGTGGNVPTPLFQKLSAGTATPEQRQAAVSQPTNIERVGSTVSGGAKNFAGGFVSAFDTTSRSPFLNPTLYLTRKYNDLFFPNATEKVADYLMESGSADIARAKEGLGAGGKLAVDVGVGATQLLGDAAIAATTGGGSVIPMAIRSFGSSTYDARQEGGSLSDQVLYGGLSAATAALVGKLSNVGGVLTKTYGKGALDDVLQSGMSRAIGKLIKNGAVSDRVATALSAGIGEGIEETIEAALSPIFQKITFDKDADLRESYSAESIGSMLYDGLVGFIIGSLAGGVSRGKANALQDTAQASAADSDAVSGVDATLNDNDITTQQRPVKKVSANLFLFDGSILSNLSIARKNLIEYARSSFPASVINTETGKRIDISRTGLDKLLSGNFNYAKYASSFHVPELIEAASKVAEAPNYKGTESIPTFEYYDSPIDIGGKDYIAHIRVKNTNMGDKYYGHTVSEVDDITVEPSARSATTEASAYPVNAIEGSIDSISQLPLKINSGAAQDSTLPQAIKAPYISEALEIKRQETQAKREALTNAYREARARNRQKTGATDALQVTQQKIDKPSDGLYNGDMWNLIPDSSSKNIKDLKIIPWDSWQNYEKATVNGHEYAKVGGRLYSRHAVDRMQPSGKRFTVGDAIIQAGGVSGRSIAPQFVEYVINSVSPVFQPATGNYIYTSGTVRIITNEYGCVVTIITKG